MGASNAIAAFMLWGHLDDRPHRALTYMALVSLDDDVTPRYWAGWQPIAEIAFRRHLPPEPARGDASAEAKRARAARRAAQVSVDEACRVLRRAGAIKTLRAGRYGQNAEYALNLRALQMQGQPASVMASTPPLLQGQPASLLQGQPASELQGQPAAKEDRGGLRNTGGTTSPQASTSPAVVLELPPGEMRAPADFRSMVPVRERLEA